MYIHYMVVPHYCSSCPTSHPLDVRQTSSPGGLFNLDAMQIPTMTQTPVLPPEPHAIKSVAQPPPLDSFLYSATPTKQQQKSPTKGKLQVPVVAASIATTTPLLPVVVPKTDHDQLQQPKTSSSSCSSSVEENGWTEEEDLMNVGDAEEEEKETIKSEEAGKKISVDDEAVAAVAVTKKTTTMTR
jgi:hypothetical protein